MDKTTLWEKCDRLAYLYSQDVVGRADVLTSEENDLFDELRTLIGISGIGRLYARSWRVRKDRQRMTKGADDAGSGQA